MGTWNSQQYKTYDQAPMSAIYTQKESTNLDQQQQKKKLQIGLNVASTYRSAAMNRMGTLNNTKPKNRIAEHVNWVHFYVER